MIRSALRVAVLAAALLAALRGWAGGAGAPVYPDRRDLGVYLDEAGRVHPVRSRRDWAIRRSHILTGMQQVMGPLPPRPAGPPATSTGT